MPWAALACALGRHGRNSQHGLTARTRCCLSRWLDKTVSEMQIELTVRDAKIQTVFAVQLKIAFSAVGKVDTSADIMAASYGADTQGLPGIEPWGQNDMPQLLFASLLLLRLVARLARLRRRKTHSSTFRLDRARPTGRWPHQDDSLQDFTTWHALNATLRHIVLLADSYQKAPPPLILLLDLCVLIALCGGAVLLMAAHASVLPISSLCDANVTLGSPPCTPYATEEAARLGDQVTSSFPLSCVAAQASADTAQSSSTCAQDSACTCGCLEQGYLYGCFRCCPDSCVKQAKAKVKYEQSGGLGWQCAAVEQEAKARKLKFPAQYQGEHKLLWPLPFNSLQGANGRGFTSWYSSGPLPLIRRRHMWRGIATVLLLLTLSARFFLLSVAASEVRAVWVASGGKGMAKLAIAVGAALAAVMAMSATAEIVFSSLVLVHGVPQGWAGFITAVCIAGVLVLGTAVVSKVHRSVMSGAARLAINLSNRPAMRRVEPHAAAQQDRDFWTMKAVFGRIASALQTCVVQGVCASMVVSAAALALYLGSGGSVPAVNTVSKAFAVILRAALFGGGDLERGRGGGGEQANVCTVVEHCKEWGLLLVWCAVVLGGLIKGLVLLQILEVSGVVRGDDSSLFVHGNRKRLFSIARDASWDGAAESDMDSNSNLDSDWASAPDSPSVDVSRDRDVHAASASEAEIDNSDSYRVREAWQEIDSDAQLGADAVGHATRPGLGAGSDPTRMHGDAQVEFPPSLRSRHRGVKSRTSILAHLRHLYVANDHVSHHYSQGRKGMSVLEDVGGGEAARLGLSRVQRLLFHRHCKTSQQLLDVALQVPANHWLRHFSTDSLELELHTRMLLAIREKLREVNQSLRLLASPRPQDVVLSPLEEQIPAPLTRGPFWQRVFPRRGGAGYARGVRGYAEAVEHDKLTLGGVQPTPKAVLSPAIRGAAALANMSPLHAMAMLRKAHERRASKLSTP